MSDIVKEMRGWVNAGASGLVSSKAVGVGLRAVDEVERLRALNAELVEALRHGQRFDCESGLLGFAIGAARNSDGSPTQLSDALAGWADEIDAALTRAKEQTRRAK